MILDSLFNRKRSVILKKIVEYSSQNQKVIAHNIANAETPGFVSKKLEFHDAFKRAIEGNNVENIKNVKAELVDNYSYPFRMDMNNVDVEAELVRMKENSMRYNLATTMLRKSIKKWAEIFEKVKD